MEFMNRGLVVANQNERARSWSRRQFLKTSALGILATPLITACQLTTSRPRVIPPDAKLRHACIGVGGMGWNDLQNFLQHNRVEIVALCDVDSQNLEKAAKAV